MQQPADANANNDLRNLGLVIFASILAASLLTFYFVYNFSPSGQYKAKNVLLAPNLFQDLNYNDTDPTTNQISRFVFGNLEFNWYDEETKTWKKLEVDQDKYSQFYNLVASDRSVDDLDSEVKLGFSTLSPSKLILNVKTESNAKWQAATKVFQETQFITDGHYFRVELHEANPGEHWAYFYHPNIYHDVKAIMVPEQ